jgi:hypothetical protein
MDTSGVSSEGNQIEPPQLRGGEGSFIQAGGRGISRWWVGLSTAGMLVVLLVLYWFPPEDHGFYPRCGLYAWTGLHCPGCGSLRAVHHLTHGRVLAAAGSNALLVLGLVAAGGYAVLRWAGFRGRLELGGGGVRWLFVACVVAVIFGVLRNLPWLPFSYLAP